MFLSWLVVSASATSVAVSVATLLVTLVYYYLKKSKLPPGPIGVPVLGYWPFVSTRGCREQFASLREKYGEVFSFWCTGTLYVNLGSHKVAKEAHILKSDCFAERPSVFNMMTDFFGDGFGFSNGEEWKALRKFFVNYIREKGSESAYAGLSGGALYESADATLEVLRRTAGRKTDLVGLLLGQCDVTLERVLFGEGKAVTDEDVKHVNRLFAPVMSWLSSSVFLPSGYLAKYFIFPFTERYNECRAYMTEAKKFVQGLVDKNKATYDEEHIRDVIDAYFKERQLRESRGDPTAKYFTDSALTSSIVGLIADGSATVAVFLALFLVALLENDGEQEKIYDELADVLGDRQPTMEDKSRLPYTNAFILEALRTRVRFFDYFPKMVCTKETTLCGYRIPKGAITLMDFNAINNDPEVYENPEKFDPTRFIVKDGQQRPDIPITFGIGKRNCIGEAFTMAQVFVFVSNIIKQFHISVPNCQKLNVAEIMATGKLEVVVQPRK